MIDLNPSPPIAAVRPPPERQPHHRIVSLAVDGGFLDGARLEFTGGLNCIIGGRGTGKTTVDARLLTWCLAHRRLLPADKDEGALARYTQLAPSQHSRRAHH
jgi:hypothetical protein